MFCAILAEGQGSIDLCNIQLTLCPSERVGEPSVKNWCQVCVRFDVGLWMLQYNVNKQVRAGDELRPAAEQFSSPAVWWEERTEREILLTTGWVILKYKPPVYHLESSSPTTDYVGWRIFIFINILYRLYGMIQFSLPFWLYEAYWADLDTWPPLHPWLVKSFTILTDDSPSLQTAQRTAWSHSSPSQEEEMGAVICDIWVPVIGSERNTIILPVSDLYLALRTIYTCPDRGNGK